MRKTYGLSDETRTVINGSFKEIAEEMGCADKYVYGIRYEDNPDPFAYFLVWYAACVRAGVEYHIYDDRMAQVRAKYRTIKTGPLNAHALLVRKFGVDASCSRTILQAIADGEISDVERQDIRAELEKVRANCDLIDGMLDDEPDVRKEARKSVASFSGGRN